MKKRHGLSPNPTFQKAILLLLLLSVCIIPSVHAETAESSNGSGGIYIIPIQGEINRSLTVFIRRGLQEARSSKADTVIFEIDTFGGLVESALQIATLIGSVDEIRSAAYIPAAPESTGVSWSAGALISFACDEIYMAPGTSIGAAAPVYSGAEGTEMAPEKTVSAVRTQMAALAEKNGYSKAVALAMVDMDIELLQVKLGDELRLVTSDDITALEIEAKQTGAELLRLRTVSPAGKLLSLTANEMLEYGISSGTPDTRGQLIDLLGGENESAVEIAESMPDRLVAALTGSGLSAILMLIGLGALYLEITTPGFGLPGTVAIIAFLVLFASNALLGFVGSVEIILFLLGVVLLVLEIFVIPGFGIAGISGILLMSASLILSRQDFVIPEFDWQREILLQNVISIAVGFIGSIILIAFVLGFLRKIPLFNRLVLDASQQQSDGYSVQQTEERDQLTGCRGTAVTTLRPSGKAEIEGKTLQVVADGEFIEAGTTIIVTAVSGNRIEVRGIE